MGLKKLPRSSMAAFRKRQLEAQGGCCLLCGEPIDLSIPKEGVVDHNHDTGEIRGILHRSCNAAEGKAANAIGRWGAKSMRYEDIVPFARRLLAYWEKPGLGLMYHTHKTPEEKVRAEKLAARKRAAESRARRRVKTGSDSNV